MCYAQVKYLAVAALGLVIGVSTQAYAVCSECVPEERFALVEGALFGESFHEETVVALREAVRDAKLQMDIAKIEACAAYNALKETPGADIFRGEFDAIMAELALRMQEFTAVSALGVAKVVGVLAAAKAYSIAALAIVDVVLIARWNELRRKNQELSRAVERYEELAAQLWLLENLDTTEIPGWVEDALSRKVVVPFGLE